MKYLFVILLVFANCSWLVAQHSTDTTTLSTVDPYNFVGYFEYDSTIYQYTITPENDKWNSLVIRCQQKVEGSDAVTFKEIYASQIVIEDKIKVEGKRTAHVKIRYAQKEGYSWKPYFNDFMQAVFLFNEGKIRYAPFGEKMIDRKAHSPVKKEAIKTQFDTNHYTLTDAVKTSVEFFIMKFPNLFSK